MIRGIDNQIMINKSIDYAKQLTDQNNNVQQGKDFIAEMEKARMEHNNKAVRETEETENGRIYREKEKKGNTDSENMPSSYRETKEEREEETEIKINIKEDLGNSIDINI